MENESQSIEEIRDKDVVKPGQGERRPSRLPLILTLIALLVWFGFQTVQLVLERNNLSTLKASFDAASQESQKMRTQLEVLITKTNELANQGNPNAKTVVQELEKRGIPINITGQPSK